MKLQMIGCSHHHTGVEARERLAFNADAGRRGAGRFAASVFPRPRRCCCRPAIGSRSTPPARIQRACRRTRRWPSSWPTFTACRSYEIFDDLFERTGEDAIRHLFTVAASLDSMVVGEPQILAQVKQAYELATARESTGPLTHSAFQAAVRVARRVTLETTIHRRRVSIPSVAVADFASEVFESFDDKRILVIGAGEMAAETLRYLQDQGAHDVTVVNRNADRARELAEAWQGKAEPWERLDELLATADLVISTTGASEPIIGRAAFKTDRGGPPAAADRDSRPGRAARFRSGDQRLPGRLSLFARRPGRSLPAQSRRARPASCPRPCTIIEEETARFMADLHHRADGADHHPVARRLAPAEGRRAAAAVQQAARLGRADAASEIRQSFDRLVNKLLHPPLESLRSEAEQGPPHGLLGSA